MVLNLITLPRTDYIDLVTIYLNSTLSEMVADKRSTINSCFLIIPGLPKNAIPICDAASTLKVAENIIFVMIILCGIFN